MGTSTLGIQLLLSSLVENEESFIRQAYFY